MEIKNKRAFEIGAPYTNARIYIVREGIEGLKNFYNIPHEDFVKLVDKFTTEFLNESLDIFEKDIIQLQDENDELKNRKQH